MTIANSDGSPASDDAKWPKICRYLRFRFPAHGSATSGVFIAHPTIPLFIRMTENMNVCHMSAGPMQLNRLEDRPRQKWSHENHIVGKNYSNSTVASNMYMTARQKTVELGVRWRIEIVEGFITEVVLGFGRVLRLSLTLHHIPSI